MSVVIPIFNPGPLLKVCLDSVARQRYPRLEIVPVDDAGPEPVKAALEAFAQAEPRAMPVFHPVNRGLAGALNSGLSRARGELVLVMEQDCELLEPDAIDRCVPLLEADPALCLTGKRVLPYREMSAAEVAFTLLRDHLPPGGEADLVPQAFSELKCDLFPRAALEKCGGFDASFRFSGEDQMLGFRLRRAGFKIREARALAYALRSAGMSSVRNNLQREFTYGRTQAALILRTSFGSLGASAAHEQGARRISNRASGTASGVALVLVPFALLLAGPGLWVAALAVPAALRVCLIAARGARLPAGFAGRRKAQALAVALSPLDDLVYTAALATGAAEYLATGKS